MLRTITAAATLILVLGTAAGAATHEVTMRNKGADGAMVFEPAFVTAAPGDTIHFKATDKGHNAETIKGMLPEGAEAFKGKMGKDLEVTLTKEGLYGVKCAPHFAMGMVALIQVGQPMNKADVAEVPMKGAAKKRFDPLLAQIAE
ncbi:Pseudoazurin precursor [Cereibacter sphaeroides WS8N]|uniref:pseudoazurin n=1 Tax=Cereibacter sphaeroides TaxID=1063 RepID=UPI00020DFAD3|nr:pseudoazurin [Cereibacter sphaeroides]EGJ22750.1 Pseudoazurin precursor [Cereibacter sphaeroides WS8N]MWP37269.1 pseudoazurin [Cereibacter sphaeroides]